MPGHKRAPGAGRLPELTRGRVGPQLPGWGFQKWFPAHAARKLCPGCSLGWADSSNSPKAPTAKDTAVRSGQQSLGVLVGSRGPGGV